MLRPEALADLRAASELGRVCSLLALPTDLFAERFAHVLGLDVQLASLVLATNLVTLSHSGFSL